MGSVDYFGSRGGSPAWGLVPSSHAGNLENVKFYEIEAGQIEYTMSGGQYRDRIHEME